MTIAPTPQSAIKGLLNFSAMRSQPPRTHHSEKPSRPVDSLPNCIGYVRMPLKTRGGLRRELAAKRL